MISSHCYPIFISLEGRHCLVAGLGNVGTRKLAGLLESNVASVLTLDLQAKTTLSSKTQTLLLDSRVTFAQRETTIEDIKSSFLVFAATGNAGVNAVIAQLCKETGALCNTVTAPCKGDFILPASVKAGTLQACVSTSGSSPMLARKLRCELAAWLEPKAEIASLMGALRPLVLDLKLSQEQNAQLFAKLAETLEASLTGQNGIDNLEHQLKQLLPISCHDKLATTLQRQNIARLQTIS